MGGDDEMVSVGGDEAETSEGEKGREWGGGRRMADGW